MSNYTKGPWDGVSDEALETDANLGSGQDDLVLFGIVDDRQDTKQEAGYSALRRALTVNTVPEKDWLIQLALLRFGESEILETINEAHVNDALARVFQARHHNHNVIGIAEENRRDAARAQQSTPA